MTKKKYFTLMKGDQIVEAPNSKIIPAKEFSTLLSADEVLKNITQDADTYRLQVSKEAEEIKEIAYKEGYENGFSKWAEHIINLEIEINNVHQELQKLVIPVALKAAKKIVGKEIELNEEIITDIVLANLKAVSQHKKITVYVNKRELEALEKNKNRLKDIFENLESLSLRERADVAPGGCIIETEVGIINAQMDHRWTILEKAFERLLKTNPAAIMGD